MLQTEGAILVNETQTSIIHMELNVGWQKQYDTVPAAKMHGCVKRQN